MKLNIILLFIIMSPGTIIGMKPKPLLEKQTIHEILKQEHFILSDCSRKKFSSSTGYNDQQFNIS